MSKNLASLAKQVESLEGVDISNASLNDDLDLYLDVPAGLVNIMLALAPGSDKDWSELKTIQDLLDIIPEKNL
ncbi:hypothetical protein PpSQ1_23225 [Pseudomonas putida]|nr:hypothetical protein PpSQ1_23225 [Pseudomonas putida]